MNPLILVVDDEPDVEVLFRQHFRRDLRAGRFTMEFAQSAPMALQRITDAGDRSLILILSDINMPGMSGLELLPKAKALRPDVPVIMITAYGDAETKRKALEGGAEALLTKPSTSGRSVTKSICELNAPRERAVLPTTDPWSTLIGCSDQYLTHSDRHCLTTPRRLGSGPACLSNKLKRWERLPKTRCCCSRCSTASESRTLCVQRRRVARACRAVPGARREATSDRPAYDRTSHHGHFLADYGRHRGRPSALRQAIALYDPAEHRALATRFGQDTWVAILAYRSSPCGCLAIPRPRSQTPTTRSRMRARSAKLPR